MNLRFVDLSVPIQEPNPGEVRGGMGAILAAEIQYQSHTDTLPECKLMFGAEPEDMDGVGIGAERLALTAHAGTHVDAPCHFDADPKAIGIDQVPLENFFTEAICLDLSHKPLKSDISIEDLQKAEQAAGVTIKPKDTVLLHMDFFRRTHGTPGFITDFPGLTKESATWLGKKGITQFGVEAVSPGRPGRSNFEVHHVCRDLGFTHIEGLVNLEKLVGKGRFKFIGFPIKIKGGTGAPIRAVAWLDG